MFLHFSPEKSYEPDDHRTHKKDEQSEPVIHDEKIYEEGQSRKWMLNQANEDVSDAFLHHGKICCGP